MNGYILYLQNKGLDTRSLRKTMTRILGLGLVLVLRGGLVSRPSRTRRDKTKPTSIKTKTSKNWS